MLIANKLMQRKIDTLCSDSGKQELPNSLKSILEEGFIIFNDGATFFKIFCTDVVKECAETKKGYFDLSGYENTINRFHFEDYIDTDLFLISINFIDSFSDCWQSLDNRKCIVVFNFQEEIEFGDSATFSFYINRDGENVININKLDDYMEPLLVKIVN